MMNMLERIYLSFRIRLYGTRKGYFRKTARKAYERKLGKKTLANK